MDEVITRAAVDPWSSVEINDFSDLSLVLRVGLLSNSRTNCLEIPEKQKSGRPESPKYFSGADNDHAFNLPQALAWDRQSSQHEYIGLRIELKPLIYVLELINFENMWCHSSKHCGSDRHAICPEFRHC